MVAIIWHIGIEVRMCCKSQPNNPALQELFAQLINPENVWKILSVSSYADAPAAKVDRASISFRPLQGGC